MAKNWLDKNEYPFESNYFMVKGNRLHYIDEGKGEVILFVHGTPSWSFDYRNVIKDLSRSFRCIAMDHIGFGLSDKPDSYDYSTMNHSDTLARFIGGLKLSKFTLVVHDFGGPIGLNFAIANPGMVSKLIILNSWLWSNNSDPEFRKLRKILKSPLLPFLYRSLNFSPKFILPKSFGDKKLSRHILMQYTRPFANRTQRNGALGFAKSLLNDQDWFEDLWNKKGTISAKPTLFVWGLKDPVIRPYQLNKFKTGFQNSYSVTIESCGHFPQEEEPEQVAQAMRSFMMQHIDSYSSHSEMTDRKLFK